MTDDPGSTDRERARHRRARVPRARRDDRDRGPCAVPHARRGERAQHRRARARARRRPRARPNGHAPPRSSGTTATSTTSNASSPRPSGRAPLDGPTRDVRAHVRATVREKLLIANPGYLPIACASSGLMRIATWNVNSLKARLPRVGGVPRLRRRRRALPPGDEARRQDLPGADVLRRSATTRCTTARVSGTASRSCRASGSRTSRTASTTRTSIPTRVTPAVVAADCGGVRFVTVYVPNGREVPSEFYDRKLVWLETLHDWLAANNSPDDPVVVLGDFNVAPEDRDVWDPKKFVGSTHVTPAERDAVVQLEKWGMEDLFRRVYPDARPALQLLGLPRRRLPPAPRHADRPRARHRARSPSAPRGPSSTATRARAPVRATTPP